MRPKEVVELLCKQYGSLTAVATKVRVTERTVNGWRRGVVLPRADSYLLLLGLWSAPFQEKRAAAYAYLEEAASPTCDGGE